MGALALYISAIWFMVSVMEAAANTISSTGSASGTVSSGAAVSSVAGAGSSAAGAAQAARLSTITAAISIAKSFFISYFSFCI